MGKIYRVTVVEEVTDQAGGYVGSETLFELAGSAVMLGELAPLAMAKAITTADATERTAEQAGDNVQEMRPRRPRRTKQQIAEDEARAKVVAEGTAPEPATATEPAPVDPAAGPVYNPFAVG